MRRRNIYLSTRRHFLILRDPLGITNDKPTTATDRLHVDHTLPTAARGILHVFMGDGGVEDRRAQLERALEGRAQVNECGRVGRVRFELELRVGRLLGEVEPKGRVRRVRVDKEDPVRFVLVRGNQGEFGEERAASVREGRGELMNSQNGGEKCEGTDLLLVCILTLVGTALS